MHLEIESGVFNQAFLDDLMDYSYRYGIEYGGRGSGKTIYLLQKLLLKSLKEERHIFLMRKYTAQIRRSLWRDMWSVIKRFHLEEYFKVNKSEFRLELKTWPHSTIECMGLDDPEKVKGLSDATDVLMDELTAFTQDDFEAVDGTVRSTAYCLPLQIYGTFNPISKANWVYEYFGFSTGKIPPNCRVHKSTYLDNKEHLDQSFIDRMENLKERNYNRWVVEALGDFVNLDKLVFNNWRIENCQNDLSKPLLIGIDFGYNDPTTIVASNIDEENKIIRVFKTYYKSGMTNKDIHNVIRLMGFAKSTIIADSAEPKSIEELRREGISRIKPAEKKAGSIISGIKKLQEYTIIIDPECEELIVEMENYTWKKNRNGVYLEEPIDDFNHCIDALRYSLQCIGVKRLSTMSKSRLF